MNWIKAKDFKPPKEEVLAWNGVEFLIGTMDVYQEVYFCENDYKIIKNVTHYCFITDIKPIL